jgi:hypothetical protein
MCILRVGVLEGAYVCMCKMFILCVRGPGMCVYVVVCMYVTDEGVRYVYSRSGIILKCVCVYDCVHAMHRTSMFLNGTGS